MIHLVGILNLTPDSFSDGGLYVDPKLAIRAAESMLADGASMIDVGAESTRPGAIKISDKEEWDRLKIVLPTLAKKYPGKISLDTYHSATAEKALQSFNVVINDVTSLNNGDMMEIIVKYKPTTVISHLRGLNTENAHKSHLIDDEMVVKNELLYKAEEMEKLGLPKAKIILDPGIGFGKTHELNIQLLKFARLVPEYEVMIGYSRKRFLGEDRMELYPNIEAGKVAVSNGATYLRIHDVTGHQQLLSI